MAGKDLTYKVNVDSSKGVAGIKSFSRAVQQELKKVEDDFDDTATQGERVAAVLSKMAGELDQELTRAAEASEALRIAMGDVGEGADVGRIVSELQRMGLSFEDIVADADKLATSLKELDAVQMKGISSGLGGVKTKFGEVDDSVRGSGSVLANMVGNATQDLGALGGLAGSAGVAIGQMGEYMTDAALGGEKLGSILTNFSKTAVPIAAIGAAIALTTKVMGDAAKREEEIAEQTANITEALLAGTGAWEDWGAAVESAFEAGTGGAETAAEAFSKSLLEGLSEENLKKTRDALGSVNALVSEFGEIATASQDDFEALISAQLQSAGATKEQADAMALAIITGKDWSGIRTILGNLIDDSDAVADSFENQIKAWEELDDQRSKVDLETSSQDFLDEQASIDANTRALVNNAREGTGSQIEAAQKYLELSVAQNRQRAKNEKLSEKERENAEKAAERDRQRLQDLKAAARAQREFNRAIQETIDAYDGTAAAAEGLQTAISDLNEASSLDFSLMAENTVDSFDTLKESLKNAKKEIKKGIDWSKIDLSPDEIDELKGLPDELAQVTQAIADMRGNIQTELEAAFATGGIDAFVDKAHFFRRQVREQFMQIFQNLGASPEEARRQVRALLDDLELLDKDIEIQITLARETAIRTTLESFATIIAGFAEPVQIRIASAVAEGDLETALFILNRQLRRRGFDPVRIPIERPPNAVINEMMDDVHGEAQDHADDNPVILPVKPVVGRYVYPPALVPSGSTTATTRMAAPATTAVTAPAVTVNVNASVMGDTFDLMRRVDETVRKAARLMPVHP